MDLVSHGGHVKRLAFDDTIRVVTGNTVAHLIAAAMNDKPEGYAYPEKVRFEINQNKLSDYSIASQFLNISQTDIVCVQHEYGLFGGPAGSLIPRGHSNGSSFGSATSRRGGVAFRGSPATAFS